MVWPVLTVLAVIAAILLGARDHPHQVAHPDRNPPVAEAVESGRWNPDLPRNDDLGAVGRFLARGKVHFAETVFTKDDENCGEIFATDKRGRIWSIEPDPDGEDPKVVAHVGGTLLGGAFDKEGGMYIADATRGLLYIAAEDLGKPGKTRIVASLAPPANLQSASSNETLDQTEIRYANDVAVDPTTGNVYFTDSTRIAPRVTSARLGDTLLSFGDSALTGDATGRLLMYSPTSGETHVLVTGIPFANGVGVMKGGSHILFVSTTTYSVYKVPVPPADEKDIGPSAKLSETDRFYAGTLAGMPDGLTVDRKDGSVWVPMFVPVLPILRFANVAPKWVRRILVSAPAFLRPGAKSVHAIIAQFDADGVLLRVLHDKQRQFGMLASVARCGKFLFCGCLSGHHVAQFDLT